MNPSPPSRFVDTHHLYTAYHDAIDQEHFFVVPRGSEARLYGVFVQQLPPQAQFDPSGFNRTWKVIVKQIQMDAQLNPAPIQRGLCEFKVQVSDNPMRDHYLPGRSQRTDPVVLSINDVISIPANHRNFASGILMHLRDWLPNRFTSIHHPVQTQWKSGAEIRQKKVTFQPPSNETYPLEAIPPHANERLAHAMRKDLGRQLLKLRRVFAKGKSPVGLRAAIVYRRQTRVASKRPLAKKKPGSRPR